MSVALRHPRVKLLAVIFGTVFAWSEVTQAWRDWGHAGRVFTYTGFIPLQLLAAAVLWQAAGRTALPGGTRRGLRHLALFFLLLALGSTDLAVITLGQPDEPRYTFADFFYLVSYIPLITGVLSLPRVHARMTSRSRALLDLAALLVISGLLVYTHATLRGELSNLGQVLSAIYPIEALAGLLALNVALTHGIALPSRRAWLLLTGALTLSLLTDIVFQTLWATGYSGPNWSLPLSVVVNLAMLWAGDWFATDPIQDSRSAEARGLPFSPLPILLAIGGAGVLVLVALKGNAAAAGPVMITLILLNVLLGVREFVLLMDATRAARVEAAAEGARRFEALVSGSSDLILVVDGAHVIRFASAPVEPLLGVTPDQVTGQPLERLVHPEDLAGMHAVLDELQLTSGQSATVALRLLHANGSWRRFEWSASNRLNEPAVRGLVLNCRDVTERSYLEEQLRQAQKMEVVGQLAGGIAHDFNNLLTTVLAGSEFALRELDAASPLREEIEGIREAAQRGAALTSRLLAFSRPSAAQSRLVRLAPLVEGSRALMQRLLGEGYTLRIRADPASGAAILDPDELEHALLNLVANARDALPEQGIVELTVADRTLEDRLDSPILAVPAGRYVVVAVRDEGPGMDPGIRDRAFEPFFTTKASGKGTGLGLAGVLAFMRRSAGGISLTTAPGAGSTFSLWFPWREPAAGAESVVTEGGVIPGSGTILLVEDDDVVRHATRRILTGSGYEVLEAPGPEVARARFATEGSRIDLLVTDVMMPGESGATLAQALRLKRPGLPVLYISGYPGEDLARLGLRLGEVELLRKPFTVRELTERVHAVLGARPPA